MASLISYNDAVSMVDDPVNCFQSITNDRHLMIAPRYLGNVVQGIKEQLNAEINMYCESLNGVVVSYSKLKLLSPNAKIVGSQPWLHVYVRATFILFKPSVGSVIKGIINKIGRDHLGLLVHGRFNATVPRPRDTDTHLSLVHGHIEGSMGRECLFEVVKIYHHNGLLSMRAKLRPDSFSVESYKGLKRKAAEIEASLNSNLSNLSVTDSPLAKRHKSGEVTEPVIKTEASASAEGSNTSKHKKKKKKSKTADLSDTFVLATPQFTSTPAGVVSHTQVAGQLDTTMLELTAGQRKKEHDAGHTALASPADNASDSTVDSGIGHVSKKKSKKSKRKTEELQPVVQVKVEKTEDTEVNVVKHHKSKKSKKDKKKHPDENR